MSKLSRVFQQLFGLNGDQSHFGQFGSRRVGPGVPTKDPTSIQSLTAFTDNGWLDAIDASNKAPFLEDMNGLFLLAFRQIAYGFQEGIAEWDPTTEYNIGSIVKKTGTFELYGSVTDINIGNALPTQTNNGFWSYLNPPATPAGVMSDFGGNAIPVGYLPCDGGIYAQSAFPNLFAAIGTIWNLFNGHTDPGAGNFRVPDMRGVVPVGQGNGLGLSVRLIGQFIGEEAHVLTIPEIPNHTHTGDYLSSPLFAGTSTATIAGATAGNFLPVSNAQAIHLVIGFTGGGGAHNNMQPSAVVNKIIKF